jgi:hypothetical protein
MWRKEKKLIAKSALIAKIGDGEERRVTGVIG